MFCLLRLLKENKIHGIIFIRKNVSNEDRWNAMRMIDIIEHKRDKGVLTKEEIDFFIKGYVNKEIPDYQVSSLLMAIYLNGFNIDETINLTFSMLNSGDVVDLKDVKGIKADKHSTGGVGDKTTLVLAPILAALDVKLAKMSGRGLGLTGGTLDKLESIPGFNIYLNSEEFIKQVNEINLAVVGQTSNLVPADKLLYALRDVTGTVSSIPLIASSIMSKKLASGADIICLDVKVGSGAFMKNIDDAKVLAKTMVKIGNMLGRKTIAVLTNMDEPLGLAVGNNLEVIEAINTLNGNGPKDLLDLCIEISSLILEQAKSINYDEAKAMVLEVIDNKKALNKLVDMVRYQGGDTSYILDTNKFDKAKHVISIKANKKGYISEITAIKIGVASMLVGAGRSKKEDSINPNVGIVLNKKVGDYVTNDDILAYLYTDELNDEALKMASEAFVIGDNKKESKLILDVIKGE